jgi:hypothetical protein
VPNDVELINLAVILIDPSVFHRIKQGFEHVIYVSLAVIGWPDGYVDCQASVQSGQLHVNTDFRDGHPKLFALLANEFLLAELAPVVVNRGWIR